MDIRTDYLGPFLQANDPLFPTGAYAHSFGLEELVRWNLVHDEGSLLAFLQKQVIPAQQHLELPYVRLAHDAAREENLDLLIEFNDEVSAWKLPREAREASTSLGTRRLQTARALSADSFMDRFTQRTAASHHVIAYGLQMARNGVPLDATLAGYLYQALAGPCSAALKLIRIGQEGVQRVLSKSLRDSGTIIEASLEVLRTDAGWFNPLLEIASMRHARANERLFIS